MGLNDQEEGRIREVDIDWYRWSKPNNNNKKLKCDLRFSTPFYEPIYKYWEYQKEMVDRKEQKNYSKK
jgi:hypothetical protein